MKIYYFLIILIFWLISASAFAEISKKVDAVLALRLINLAKVGTKYEHLGFGGPSEDKDEDFLIAQFLYDIAGTAGWLGVNPWTGDVWDMDECKRLSTSRLLKAQKKIKQQFSATELNEYKRLSQIKPHHMYDLEPCP